MKIIRCSKSSCSKEYKGNSFDQIAKDNNLEKIGVFYYCKGCSGNSITKKILKSKSDKIIKTRESKKQVIDNSGV